MSRFILLTAGQAAAVRGPSAIDDEAALNPAALTDGRFILNIAVLDDPAHVQHRPLLAGLPQADFSEISALMPTGGP